MAKVSRAPWSAHVIAVAALVVALSGTAYAAATITGADIVDGTIRGADIRSGAVASVDIKTGGVQGDDIADGAIGASDLAAGVVPNLLWLREGGPGLAPSADGVAVTSHTGTGLYGLQFDRSVEDCALAVTPVSSSSVLARVAQTGPDTVTVALVDTSGSPTESEFSVLAVCA